MNFKLVAAVLLTCAACAACEVKDPNQETSRSYSQFEEDHLISCEFFVRGDKIVAGYVFYAPKGGELPAVETRWSKGESGDTILINGKVVRDPDDGRILLFVNHGGKDDVEVIETTPDELAKLEQEARSGKYVKRRLQEAAERDGQD